MTTDANRLEANKQGIRDFFRRVWNEGEEGAIDEYVSERAVGNDADFGAGREAFRRQWREWRAAMPDLHFEVEELVAEGNVVVSRWTLTGTHTGGPLFGVPASGSAIRVGGMSLDHLQDGVLVSGFDGWDALGLRKQIGALPQDA